MLSADYELHSTAKLSAWMSHEHSDHPMHTMNSINCSPRVFSDALSFLLQVQQLELNNAFGQALKNARPRRGGTQEDFGAISSQTYISSLERGIKAVTLNKLTAIAQVMDAHLLSIMVEGFVLQSGESLKDIFEKIRIELAEMQ